MSNAEARGPRLDALARVEGRDKVTGAATYAHEYPVDDVAYAWPVTATVAAGRVRAVDVEGALREPGVRAVLWHANAPRLVDTGEALATVLQSAEVAYRGQLVALVVADTAEQARETASRLDVTYDSAPHDVTFSAESPALYTPESGDEVTTTERDTAAAFGASPVQVAATYRTPPQHNCPMEPHATTAVWDGERLTVYDSTQGGHPVRATLAKAFGIDPDRVRVVARHVGGGFGAKGTPRPAVMLATLAAREVGRPVKIALTRQQLFDLVGYRTPTIQTVRLGADTDGRLRSICHESVEQTSTVEEFTEGATAATTMMYAAPHRHTAQRLVRLDVAVTSWMRAPGECPGMYALESAMDELAVATGIDPVELRVRNEPPVDPGTGAPFSSRHLVECLRLGAERFGWDGRDPRPRSSQIGGELVGTGMASSTYPVNVMPASARARAEPGGRFTVSINATDIGTGARTALLMLAAEALGTTPDGVRVRIGDTDLPRAWVAGGSTGTTSWGMAVTKACTRLCSTLASRHPGGVPAEGVEVTVDIDDDIEAMSEVSRHAFGAQFVEVRVDSATGEIRVPRMTGVFAAGRIVNARTARSQLVGAMTMGLSMALHEEGVVDAAFGGFANHDLAGYSIATTADVGDIDVTWLDEDDDDVNPIGTKGVGEIGIVGTAAAIANAVYHATGVRVRDLPIRLDKVGVLGAASR
ncbi:MAG: xanthine dehydrogenase family protein molybdopterin-binding subunit [Nocardioidaceae bacterium]